MIASLVFPVWLVTFLVDEGPVGLSVALLLLALLAARRALQAPSSGASAAWAAAAGFALFLGLWTKLVFAWWLPAVAVFVLRGGPPPGPVAGGGRRGAGSRRSWPGPRSWPRPPRSCSRASTATAGPTPPRCGREASRPSRRTWRRWRSRLVQYVTDGSLVAPRNLLLPGSRTRRPAAAAERRAAAPRLAPRRRGGARSRRGRSWRRVTFGFVASSGYSRWPHHFAFPLLPLVLALALAARRPRPAGAARRRGAGGRLLGVARRAAARRADARRVLAGQGPAARLRARAGTRPREPPGARELGHLLHRAALRRPGPDGRLRPQGGATIRRGSGRWRSSPARRDDRCCC